MSLITQYRQAQLDFEAAQARLESIQQNPALKALQDFEAQLRELMAKYGMSLKDVNALLDPESVQDTQKKRAPANRKARIFKNPHTGEVVETYGPTTKVLEEWKAKHGADTVKSWQVLSE